MKLPTAHRTPLEMNLTPLIDVVFLLNIFFLVAAYYIRHEQVDPVQLPLAQEGVEDVESSARVVVTVTANGILTLGSNVVSVDEAVQRVAEVHAEHPDGAEFRLRCDQLTEYSAVEPLLLGAVEHGVTKVRFSVLPK
ncbi:biopolymer transporter ExbD [bacterium]|nr:biopolymer transporter ExbD [bacterium]